MVKIYMKLARQCIVDGLMSRQCIVDGMMSRQCIVDGLMSGGTFMHIQDKNTFNNYIQINIEIRKGWYNQVQRRLTVMGTDGSGRKNSLVVFTMRLLFSGSDNRSLICKESCTHDCSWLRFYTIT